LQSFLLTSNRSPKDDDRYSIAIQSELDRN
jgi:hypothetical protein